MYSGVPRIPRDAGPLPEVAGDAAVLMKPEDAGAWARAITRVLTNQPYASQLRDRGFSRAGDFTWQRTAEATREAYREALLA